MLARPRTLPTDFIAPCLPTKAHTLPSGSLWLHEIKHDGFRIIARKKGAQVRLYSRPGNDFTRRFPLIVETLARLRSRSCIIDGEANERQFPHLVELAIPPEGFRGVGHALIVALELAEQLLALEAVDALGEGPGERRGAGGRCGSGIVRTGR